MRATRIRWPAQDEDAPAQVRGFFDDVRHYNRRYVRLLAQLDGQPL